MQCINCRSTHLQYDSKNDAYVCLNCGHVYPKEYWFISHSHLDIEKVRVVRNVIEEIFFYEPILFFLKCLSNDEEVTDLIHREIFERVWFVYCQSKNSAVSKYVQDERQYFDKLVDAGYVKHKIEIDLDQYEHWEDMCAADIRRQVFSKIRKDKVFISHSMRDRAIAHSIYEYLQERSYTVFNAESSVSLTENWGESVESAIRRHITYDGVFLLIVSENALKSKYVFAEMKYAVDNSAYIIPVILSDGSSSEGQLYNRLIEANPALAKYNYVTFNVNEPEQSCARLEDLLNYFYYLDTNR